MITMIGTGHVFRIADSVSFIIKNSWPEAVLVELDEKRYKALTDPKIADTSITSSKGVSKIYLKSAKYQDKMSEKNDTQTGGELLAAINTGKLVEADIICIDKDAEKVMKELWEEMSFMERRKYSFSIFTDNILGKKKIDKTQKEFSADENYYIEEMRKKYPTLVKKLIDERNEYMAKRIREASEKYKSMIIVVGDAHVEGLCKILNDIPVKKVRLAELLDKESLDKLKSQVWNDRTYTEESK